MGYQSNQNNLQTNRLDKTEAPPLSKQKSLLRTISGNFSSGRFGRFFTSEQRPPLGTRSAQHQDPFLVCREASITSPEVRRGSTCRRTTCTMSLDSENRRKNNVCTWRPRTRPTSKCSLSLSPSRQLSGMGSCPPLPLEVLVRYD